MILRGVRRVGRSFLRRAPGRYAQLALRMREVLNPQPVQWDEAALELHRQERRSRGLVPYPQYLYGLASAARTAVATGQRAFTAMEFGVAGGNGLRALELHAARLERRYGIRIATIGFDSGAGIPPASDPRDSPFALQAGDFPMDEGRLRTRLTRSRLVLGRVEETVRPFLESADGLALPPVGFVSFDLDVYTGTRSALEAITSRRPNLLPRVTMYFDDLSGYPYTTETGEWAAISVFNERTDRMRIGQVANLEYQLGGTARIQNWPRQVFVLHVFDHPDYGCEEGTSMPNTALSG